MRHRQTTTETYLYHVSATLQFASEILDADDLEKEEVDEERDKKDIRESEMASASLAACPGKRAGSAPGACRRHHASSKGIPLFAVLLVLMLVALYSAPCFGGVGWSAYRNRVFGFEIRYPSAFTISEGYKRTWWKPEHGRGDLLRQGVSVRFLPPGREAGGALLLEVACRRCDGLPPWSEMNGEGKPVLLSRVQPRQSDRCTGTSDDFLLRHERSLRCAGFPYCREGHDQIQTTR